MKGSFALPAASLWLGVAVGQVAIPEQVLGGIISPGTYCPDYKTYSVFPQYVLSPSYGNVLK
jgi:hypothetical protein